jgi:hypothetical protein
LDIVKYLHTHRTEGASAAAMRDAVQNGHLEIVKFLRDHQLGECTIYLLMVAAQNGHLDLVQYLHRQMNEDGTKFCGKMAMQCAAGHGYLDVVKFLHAGNHVYAALCMCNQFNAMSANAAANGHLKVVQFLTPLKRASSVFCMSRVHADLFTKAATNGHLDLLRWLWEDYYPRRSRSTRPNNSELVINTDGAVANGHLDVLVFLHKHNLAKSFSVHEASLSWDVNLIQWVVDQNALAQTSQTFDEQMAYVLAESFHKWN